MPTFIFKEDIIRQKELLISTILEGGIIVYPTDTVYGIGGRADRDEVIERVYKIKKRNSTLPLNVIVPDFNYIESYFSLKSEQKKILYKYLPGPYTILLPPKEACSISKLTYSNLDKKGIRICNHYIQDLVHELQIPLISTSANISGEKSPSLFDDISAQLLKEVDVIIVDDEHVKGQASQILEFITSSEDGKETIKYVRT